MIQRFFLRGRPRFVGDKVFAALLSIGLFATVMSTAPAAGRRYDEQEVKCPTAAENCTAFPRCKLPGEGQPWQYCIWYPVYALCNCGPM